MAVADKARQLREQGHDVIAFGAGEPDFDTPAHIRAALVRALEAGDTRYPSPSSGKTPLRKAICEYLSKYCGTEYSPNQVCVTVGAKDALYLGFASLLNPGDEVVIPAPYWVSYPDQVRLFGGVPVIVRSRTPGEFKITPAELEQALTPRTRVVVFNSPCNPSGVVYCRDEIAALAAVVARSDAVVFSDEIYHRLVFDGPAFSSFAAAPGMLERTLTVNGWSKSFAMTGWRLGFAAGPAGLIEAMGRLQGQMTSGATSFVQTAAIDALSGDQDCVEKMRQEYLRRGELMTRGLNALPGVKCRRPDGAFYCFPDVSGAFERLGVQDADGFAAAVLERAHVAVVSGTPFGMPTHARLSFATSERLIEEGLRRMAALLGG